MESSSSTPSSAAHPWFTPWLIWGLAAIFFLAEYFARVAPSVMVPELMHAFSANALTIGTLSAMFYYAYIPMQIPVGALVDALSSRWLLALMAMLCALAAILFSVTKLLAIAMLARFVLGLAAAFAFVGALKLAYSWFPNHRFGFLAGTTQALGMLGAAIGEGPVALLKNQVGWRASMLIIGLFLFVLALLMALLIRDKKTIRPPTSIYHLIRHSYSGLRQVISMPVIWINGLFIGFLYAPTQSFAELWGPSYLHTIYHLPMETAGGLTSLIFIGWAIGSPIAGWISDRIGRRKPILWASASLSLIIMSMILYLPHLGTSALGFLLFTYGLSNVGVATSYAIAAESSPEKREGTAMGFTNMASISVGAILQPMIGLLLDHAAGPVKHHSSAIYTAAHFHFAMSLLPLSFIICLISCCFLKESYPRQKKEK